MKKLLCIGLLFMTLLAGCSGQEKRQEGNEVSSLITDTGMYFIDENMNGKNLVKFYDFHEGKTIALCDKVNCKHEDDTCPAVRLAEFDGYRLIYFGNYQNDLYLYYTKDDEEGLLRKANAKGTDLKTIFNTPKNTMINEFGVYQDHIFYTYNRMGYLNEEETSFGTTSNNIVAVYDMKTKKQKDLTKADTNKNGYCMYIGYQDKKAYYMDYSYDNKERPIYEYDIESEKTNMIDDKNTIDTSVMYNGKLYYADEKEKTIYSYDFFHQKKEALTTFKGHRGEFTFLSRDGLVQLVYLVNPETNEAKRYVQVYDTKTKTFLFEDYRDGYEVDYRTNHGYIGTKNYHWGIYDEAMEIHSL